MLCVREEPAMKAIFLLHKGTALKMLRAAILKSLVPSHDAATSQHATGSCSFSPKGEQEATGEKYLPQSSPMKSRCLYILNMAMVQSVTRNRRCLVPIDHKSGIGFSSVFDTVFRYCICQFFLRYCGIEYFLKVPHLRKANKLIHRGTA